MAKTNTAKRKEAAEEVCFALILMMALGGLEIPMEWRPFLAEPMAEWASLATKTGILQSEEPEQTGARHG